MYYSCRYKRGSSDFVVNYTLDNSITVIGKVNGEYVNKTGYLIDSNIPDTSPEIVTENLMIVDDSGNYNLGEYQYITYNGQKIYKDNNSTQYFYYSSDYKKDFVNSIDVLEYLNDHMSGGNLYSDSAKQYYDLAKEFTDWVNTNLGNITQENAVDAEGNRLNFSVDTGSETIFNTLRNGNNPLKSDSTFNENRVAVIRKSIETNLITAIQTFSSRSSTQYNFAMPELSETEWYNIENNIAMVTFLQGIPIGGKIYNNYCVVSNNTNEEMISEDSIYVIDSNNEYHKPGCKKLVNNLKSGSVSIKGMYSSTDFKRQTVSLTGADSNAHTQLTGSSSSNYAYYYRHSPNAGGTEAYTSCYDCIVTISDSYNVDDIVSGIGEFRNLGDYTNMFLKALARERYDIYITNGYLIK